MNSDQRWLVGKFLDELHTLKLGEQPPMHTTDRRLQFVEMLLVELPGNDLEEMAWRATASAAQDLCLQPTDRGAITQFLAALATHADLLRSVFPGLS
jgi:hypothetical protein